MCSARSTSGTIRRPTPPELQSLVALWLRSVRATHAFLSEDDIQFFLPLVREHYAGDGLDVWVLVSDADDIAGFMEMAGGKIEGLFLAPEFIGQGGGRRMVQHAQALHGEVTVDVNEQNAAAVRFYEACGFVVEGRSAVDGMGKPFPLLHMRLAAPMS